MKRSLIGLGILLFLSACETDSRDSGLPYLGIHDTERLPDGRIDTLYYTLPYFSLTGADGNDLNADVLEGKVCVASFIFTHCPTICPVMNSQMARLQTRLIDNGMREDVRLISFSIDPDRDTPERLTEYAGMVGAERDFWYFATGNQEELLWIAKEGYYQNALADSLSPGGFAHSEMFVLADRKGHIRGQYDGTSSKDVNRLFGDIKKLIKEP
jgi:protein SCO1